MFAANWDERLLHEVPPLHAMKKHVLVGDCMNTYHLQCEFFILHPDGEGDLGGPPFKLRLARETALGKVCHGWPQVRSETCFLVDLVQLNVDKWDVFVLNADMDQLHVFQIQAQRAFAFKELEALEVERLRQAHAARLLKRMVEATSGKKRLKRRKGRGKGRGKGHAKGRGKAGEDIVSDSDESGMLTDHDAGGTVSDHDEPMEHIGADAREKRRRDVSVPWGTGVWALADITGPGKEIIGVGAFCKCHDSPGIRSICKKQVTIGKSGLSVKTLQLRMKRWLVAGLDDDDWDTDDPRQYHMDLGKAHYLADFEHGLGEEELDAIASGLR